MPDDPGRPRLGRDARHPDLGQLHPQRHRRPVRRRRRRRDRRSAPRMPRSCASGRACIRSSRFLPRKFKIAMTGAPSTTAPRSRSTTSACRLTTNDGGRDRLRGLCRRRPGPHADDRQDDPRLPAGRGPARLSRGDHARLQPATAGATTSTRRASRSSSTRPASRASRARSRPSSPSCKDGVLTLPQSEIDAHHRLFRAAGLRAAPPTATIDVARETIARSAPSAAGSTTTSCRTSSPAMPRSPSR